MLAQSLNSHSMYESGEKDAILRLLPCRKSLFVLNNFYVIALYLREKDSEANEKMVAAYVIDCVAVSLILGGAIQRQCGFVDRS